MMTLPECIRLLDMSRKLDPMVATEESRSQDQPQRDRLKEAMQETEQAREKWKNQEGPTNLDT